MAVGPGLHSRVVAILKVGLPLVAVAMLAPLFLISTETRTEGRRIVFSDADLAALGSGMRVTSPVFSGETAEDDRFRFSAAVVTPDAAPPTRAEIATLSGEIDFVDGPTMRLAAAAASLDIEARRMTLRGPVSLSTSDGYAFVAEEVRLDLGAGAMEAEGAVEGAGPMGRIASGRLSVSPPVGHDDARTFLFQDDVRLVYDPRDRIEPGRD